MPFPNIIIIILKLKEIPISKSFFLIFSYGIEILKYWISFDKNGNILFLYIGSQSFALLSARPCGSLVRRREYQNEKCQNRDDRFIGCLTLCFAHIYSDSYKSIIQIIIKTIILVNWRNIKHIHLQQLLNF